MQDIKLEENGNIYANAQNCEIGSSRNIQSKGKMSLWKTGSFILCLVVAIAFASATFAMFTKVMNIEAMLNKPTTSCNETTSTGAKRDNVDTIPEEQHEEIKNLSLYQTELKQTFQEIKLLVTPASCLGSSVYGRQHLRSGEEVFCDNGWTVIQRRLDGSISFDRDWIDYKSGFGNMSGEFWLGLDKIHELTANKGCRMRVDLWSFADERVFAKYSWFHVESESYLYRIRVGGYSGNAGDSLSGTHNERPFTTRDRDNDLRAGTNCATTSLHKAGAWWHKDCFRSSLNAQWGRSTGAWNNIIWYEWKGMNEALKATLMRVRCD